MATYYLQYSRDSKIIANIYKYIYIKRCTFATFSHFGPGGQRVTGPLYKNTVGA